MQPFYYFYNMKLSILICTLPSRFDKLKMLLFSLKNQTTNDVEILYLGDDKGMSVGKKRNRLLQMAQGKYCTFIDDDDTISSHYIGELLQTIDNNNGVDVICFNVEISTNGSEWKNVYYSKKYEKDLNFADHYQRIPNHLMCFRTDLAKKVLYKDVSFGEDAQWAKEILPYIESETIIPKTLYYYHANHATSETLPIRNYSIRQQK